MCIYHNVIPYLHNNNIDNVFCICQIYLAITQINSCSKWHIYFHFMCNLPYKIQLVISGKMNLMTYLPSQKTICFCVFSKELTPPLKRLEKLQLSLRKKKIPMKTLVPIEQKHGTHLSVYVRYRTYDAPIVTIVQYTPPLLADTSKTVKCQNISTSTSTLTK